MDKLKQLMERLADATDTELSAGLAAIRDEAARLSEEGPSAEAVEALKTLKTYRDAFKAELDKDTRVEARTALATEHENLLGEFSADDDSDQDGDGEQDGDAGAEGAPDESAGAAEGDTAAEGESDTSDAVEPQPVTASSKPAPLGSISKRRKAPKAPARFSGQAVATTRSASEQMGARGENNILMGQKLDRRGLAQAFTAKANAVRSAGRGSPERFTVATVETEFPAERVLDKKDFWGNLEKIENASPARQAQLQGEQGLTAALCLPLEPVYDIRVIGSTARPIRDTAMTRFAVERGGLVYRQPFSALPGLDGTGPGLGIWIPADDDADPLVPKECLKVDCPTPVSANVYATWLCLTFCNTSARFDPEWVDATIEAAQIAWARYAENQLLVRLLAGSKQLTAPVQVSATRDTLTNLDKVLAYYRYRHRLDSMVPMRWVAPQQVKDLLRADITRGLGNPTLEVLAVADATIERWFAARSTRVTWHLDGLAAGGYSALENPDNPLTLTIAAGDGNVYADAAAASPIPDFYETLETALYPDGDWLHLDGGTMDLGVVRDSVLNSQNCYQIFTETWEGAAFNGLESLRLTMDVEPTGLAVGTTMPPASDVATLPARTTVTP